MQFLPGDFETEWMRGRAAVLRDLAAEPANAGQFAWEWSRRRGQVRLPTEDGLASRSHGSFLPAANAPRARESGVERSMRHRFSALAKGSQPAVVKLASFGGGGRAVSMMNYISRTGEIAVHNELGERILGKAQLAETRAGWEHLFDYRPNSRDLGVFHVSVEGMTRLGTEEEVDAVARQILHAGLGERRFAYAILSKGSDRIEIEGVMVLRDRAGDRLTGDPKAAAIVQQRLAANEATASSVQFQFSGHGNGVAYGTARLRDLVERFDGAVRDETGRVIATTALAACLVQREWRGDLHSRKGRDVMHLVISAQAETNQDRFARAVSDFLGDQFAGHRYVFAVHDPAADPKERQTGGKRPHVHAHAIVTMRSEYGGRTHPNLPIFRQWRLTMAEKARARGIAMEMTDRRENANAPAFTHKQVRPVSCAERTEHEGTSAAAQLRYEAKRANRLSVASSARSREYSMLARQAWEAVAESSGTPAEATSARRQIERITKASALADLNRQALRDRSLLAFPASEYHVGKKEGSMQKMTRKQFDVYEKRVRSKLDDVEKALDESARQDFAKVAGAARDIVNIRRAHLLLSEQIEAENRGVQSMIGRSARDAAAERELRKEDRPIANSKRLGRLTQSLGERIEKYSDNRER